MSEFDGVPLEEGGHVQAKRGNRGRWFALGGVSVLMCVAGVVYTNIRVRIDPISMHVSRGHQFARKFVSTLRALEDDDEADFESKMHLLFKEQGADDPDVMVITGTLEKAEEKEDAPSLKIKFKSKEGEADKLKTQLETVFEATADFMGDMYGDEAVDQIAKLITVLEPEGDTVTLKLIDPNPESFDELKDDVEKESPHYEFSLSFGAGIPDILTDHPSSVISALKGVKWDGSLKLSEAALGHLEDMSMGPHGGGLQNLKDLASEDVKMEVIHRKDAKFQGIPTVDMVLEMVVRAAGQPPADIQESLKGLDKFADGLDSITMDGLPGDLELKVQCKNVHIAPALKYIIENASPPNFPFGPGPTGPSGGPSGA